MLNSTTSCAPLYSRSMDGSQSLTVSNFSLASRSRVNIDVRLADACVNDADVSDAGEVRVARCCVRDARPEAVVVAFIRVEDRRARDWRRWAICREDSVRCFMCCTFRLAADDGLPEGVDNGKWVLPPGALCVKSIEEVDGDMLILIMVFTKPCNE